MADRAKSIAASVLLVLLIVLTSIACVVAIRSGRSPWWQLAAALVTGFFVWLTYAKLTRSEPVQDFWDGHIRYFLTGLVLVFGGFGFGIGSGEPVSISERLLGALAGFVGILMLIAEQRDFRLWRAQISQERGPSRTWPVGFHLGDSEGLPRYDAKYDKGEDRRHPPA